MKLPGRLSNGLARLPFLAVVLGAALFGGCNTYHYYDIDVKFTTSSFSESQASVMKLCLVDISGAASDTVALNCPPDKYPDLGTFEYATFADSGTITFTFNGFYNTPPSSGNQCTSGVTMLTASSQITQTGTITVSNFDTTKCPLMVTGTQ